MNPSQIAEAFYRLGRALENTGYSKLELAVRKAKEGNTWFDDESIAHALEYWSKVLTRENLHTWIEREQLTHPGSPLQVGIVMASNIPLVGLHDLLSVLLCGQVAIVKPGREDQALIGFVIDQLKSFDPWFEKHIRIVERMNEADAIIATGSNNSSRYFEYYFSHLPHIIRKNRNSLAVLHGGENAEELEALGKDIFTYYGQGCRNITHLLLPEGFSPTRVYDHLESYAGVIHHNKYANNYIYHRALFLMNRQEHLDNNFLLMKEDPALYSPVGCLNYSYYRDSNELNAYLEANAEHIQVIVSSQDLSVPTVKPGHSQQPALWDYADGVNTVAFCRSLGQGSAL